VAVSSRLRLILLTFPGHFHRPFFFSTPSKNWTFQTVPKSSGAIRSRRSIDHLSGSARVKESAKNRHPFSCPSLRRGIHSIGAGCPQFLMNTGFTANHHHRFQTPIDRRKRRHVPAFPHGNWCLFVSISTHSSTYFEPACSQYRDVSISVQRKFAPKTGLKTPQKRTKPTRHLLDQSTGEPIPTHPSRTVASVTEGLPANIRYFCLFINFFFRNDFSSSSGYRAREFLSKRAFRQRETIALALFYSQRTLYLCPTS